MLYDESIDTGLVLAALAAASPDHIKRVLTVAVNLLSSLRSENASLRAEIYSLKRRASDVSEPQQ